MKKKTNVSVTKGAKAPAKKKAKTAAKKTLKAPAKKNTQSNSVKKAKSPAKKKAVMISKKSVKKPLKKIAKKRIKVATKKIVKVSDRMNAKTPAKKRELVATKEISSRLDGKKPIKFVRTRINKPSPEAKVPAIEPTLPEVSGPVEQTHSVPGEGGMHPVSTLESHVIERGLHHKEEVAFHSENKKVQDARASRKNSKRTYRMTGQR